MNANASDLSRLLSIARRPMLARGLLPRFSPTALAQANAIGKVTSDAAKTES